MSRHHAAQQPRDRRERHRGQVVFADAAVLDRDLPVANGSPRPRRALRVRARERDRHGCAERSAEQPIGSPASFGCFASHASTASPSCSSYQPSVVGLRFFCATSGSPARRSSSRRGAGTARSARRASGRARILGQHDDAGDACRAAPSRRASRPRRPRCARAALVEVRKRPRGRAAPPVEEQPRGARGEQGRALSARRNSSAGGGVCHSVAVRPNGTGPRGSTAPRGPCTPFSRLQLHDAVRLRHPPASSR